MAQIETLSKAEAVKQQSRQLRGNLARDLADTAHPFDNAGYSLLKFHGIYQGYDRDSATERKQRGDDKVWQFMVRVRIPGGRLTADQYLALDDLADGYANGSLRVTTRQSVQFHGVLKPGLKAAIASINQAVLTTLAACGDVVRTVTTVPAPIRDPVHRRLEDDARRLATPVAFSEPVDLLDAAAAVVRLHRDWGDRGNRRHARLKYVIAERGEEWARERLSEYLGRPLAPCRPMPDFAVPDHLGWHEQGDGRLYLGLPIASGRIVDDEHSRLRTALREIVGQF